MSRIWRDRDDFYKTVVKHAKKRAKRGLEKSSRNISKEVTDYYDDVTGMKDVPVVGGFISGIENWWKGGPDVNYEKEVYDDVWLNVGARDDTIQAFKDFESSQEKNIIEGYQKDILGGVVTAIGITAGLPPKLFGGTGTILDKLGLKEGSHKKLLDALLSIIRREPEVIPEDESSYPETALIDKFKGGY